MMGQFQSLVMKILRWHELSSLSKKDVSSNKVSILSGWNEGGVGGVQMCPLWVLMEVVY